jgi:hypothetical protein
MPAILRIEEKEGYLHAIVMGEYSPENIFTYLMQIHVACIEHDCPFVLLEENLKGPSLDLKTIFEIVSRSSEYAEKAVKRIAYVDTNPEHDRAKMEYAGNVAVGLGIDVRIFRTVEEARQWLVARTTPPPRKAPPA